jgi:hypothetical protein
MSRIRKLAGALAWVAFLAVVFVLFQWTDYHSKGTSGIFGINPRCTHQSGGHCFKLDTTNLTWDATAALWLDQAILVGMIGGAVIFIVVTLVGAGLLVTSVVIFPRDREAAMLSRLADSRWLFLGAWGFGWIVTGVIVLALLWAELPKLGALAILPCGIMGSLLAGWILEIWAPQYRHERWKLAVEREVQSSEVENSD